MLGPRECSGTQGAFELFGMSVGGFRSRSPLSLVAVELAF